MFNLLFNLLLIEALFLQHLLQFETLHLQLPLPLMLKDSKVGLSVCLSVQPPTNTGLFIEQCDIKQEKKKQT